jgi:hypothetical protein
VWRIDPEKLNLNLRYTRLVFPRKKLAVDIDIALGKLRPRPLIVNEAPASLAEFSA